MGIGDYYVEFRHHLDRELQFKAVARIVTAIVPSEGEVRHEPADLYFVATQYSVCSDHLGQVIKVAHLSLDHLKRAEIAIERQTDVALTGWVTESIEDGV